MKKPIYITKDKLMFLSSIKDDASGVTNCFGEEIIVDENTDVVIAKEYELKFSGGEKRLLVQTKKEFKLKDGNKTRLYRWCNTNQIKIKEETITTK